MYRITSFELPKDLKVHFGKQDAFNIRRREPYQVDSFSKLMRWSAEIACLNPSCMVLYRGQRQEYRNSDNTLLMPSLYRWENGSKPTGKTVKERMCLLNEAADCLLGFVEKEIHRSNYTKQQLGLEQLRKRPSLRWAILQHYSYCATPYLDVTQSLRVACMFALDGAREDDHPCVYMLGVPFLTDKFFTDSNDELVVVRLLSAMPPIAQRAYFQEGYLVGSEFDKGTYVASNDVAQRLLAKFELVGDKRQWIEQLSTFPRRDVYSEDYFSKIRQRVMEEVAGKTEARMTQDTSLELENNDVFPSLALG